MQHIIYSQALLKVLFTFRKHLDFFLKNAAKFMNSLISCDRFLQDIPSSEYDLIKQNFSPNRNFNLAVAEIPLRRTNCKTVVTMKAIDLLIRIICPEDSNCVKEEYFNEKSNHYSRFGKADPDSSAVGRRTSPAFYRI